MRVSKVHLQNVTREKNQATVRTGIAYPLNVERLPRTVFNASTHLNGISDIAILHHSTSYLIEQQRLQRVSTDHVLNMDETSIRLAVVRCFRLQR